MYAYIYQSPVGPLLLAEENGAVTRVCFYNNQLLESYELQKTPLLEKTFVQLQEYFAGKRKSFDLPLAPCGTEFQQQVWQALLTIPYGETASYKKIAEKIDSPQACRAVGMANNKNPIAIIIPCHRVIGANQKLVGYAGGLQIKDYLLNLEKGQVSFQNI